MALPLEGIIILDLTRLLPGPFATWILQSWGADVVKVEDPGAGDYMRTAPFAGTVPGAHFATLNRGKRSIVLDLRSEQGREAFFEVARQRPVIVESFRPGVLDRLGIGYEALKEKIPEVIVCSISGYGQTGAYRDRAGHDLNYVALSGFLGLNAPPNGAPTMPGTQLADVAGGSLPAVGALLAALLRQKTTGEGAKIDIGMADWATMLLPFSHTDRATGQTPRGGSTMLTGSLVCYNIYETKDGRHMALSALEPKFYQAFCRAVERPDLLEHHLDPAVEGGPGFEKMQVLFKSYTFEEWKRMLAGADCCAEPILHLEEIPDTPLAKDRGWFGPTRLDGCEEPVSLPCLPDVFGEGNAPGGAVPGQGEHTREVLEEAGCSEERIRAILSRIEKG